MSHLAAIVLWLCAHVSVSAGRDPQRLDKHKHAEIHAEITIKGDF